MRRATTVRIAGAAVAAGTALAMAVTAPAAQAAPKQSPASAAANGSQSVIVVLKDQLRGEPANRAHVGARKTATRQAQDAVLASLRGAKPTHVINYTVGNAFAATVTAAQVAQLEANPQVASVVPNRKVQVAPPAAAPTPQAQPKASTSSGTTGPSPVDPSACSTNARKPLLEPEALQTIHARSDDPSAKTAAALGIDGAGVKVAFIADGINPNNSGFRRTDGTSSIVDYKDFYGDGPNAVTSGAEAFGDASAISAQGNVVYDVANFANPSVVSFPGGHCYIRIVGVAPGADVVALKAGSELLPNSAILQAIDYAVSTAHVDVINESFGANVYPDSGARNTIELFNDNAVAAGVTVTTSTGDAGITSTIGNPATDPNVISAGASTDSRLYEQTGYALATRFGSGHWQDSNISALSSAGITQNGRTIDISAPGEADWAVCDNSGRFLGCTSFGNPTHHYSSIEAFGGTSQSAPITAGVAALVIQAYRKTHGSASPSPAVVKQIITSTARDLDLPGEEQGSGLIDARAAVEAALTWPGATSTAPSGTGQNVALSTNQLTLTGQTGSTVHGSVTVTNVGTQTQTIATSTRQYTQLSRSTATVNMDTSSAQTVPYPTNGAPWVYKKVQFVVPSGADELSSTIRWQSGATYNGPGPVVRMSLFAPDGSFATNTRPQGGANPANYGLVTVKRPAPGTWTAVLYTPKSGGFTGPVAMLDQTYRALPVGSVSPSTAAIAPGASRSVSVSFPVPTVGGDTVNTVSIGSSGGHQVAVPVIVRALVPTGSTPGHFAGTITGGNARAYSPAQTFSYAFNVPSGQRDLDVSVSLNTDPQDLLEGVLVDPRGEVPSINSNQSLSPTYQTVQGKSMQNTVANPTPGRWRYVVVVQSPVSGKEFKQGFTGTVAFNRMAVQAQSLPATIPAGTTATRTITVRNTGKAPMLVQTDARSGPMQQVQLAPQFAGSTITLPQSVDDLSQLPGYLVAPDTRSVSLTASSTVPAQVELNSPGGGIDVFGDLQSAQGGNTISTASVSESPGDTVGLGYWFTYVQEIGPFGDGGAPSGTSVLSAVATMVGFDQAVSTSTGDPFVATVDPTANTGAPLVIEPGQTGTITVHVTASGHAGQQRSGVLHLVTTPIAVAGLFNTTGEVLANIPYRYTVG
jgi:hypothetical protein